MNLSNLFVKTSNLVVSCLWAKCQNLLISDRPNAPKVLILAPHPDDECVMGGLPLRLMREAGSEVVILPITYGSDTNRKEERKKN